MFQSEIGENGTPHLQGWLVFKTKKRPKSVITNPRIHWEKMRGTVDENIFYCSKSDTHDNKVRFCKGCRFPYTGPQITLRPWQEHVVNILKGEPDERTVYWIWSQAGNMGKSTFAKWLFMNLDGVIVTGGKAVDMKNGVLTYKQNNFDTPKIVLVDVPRVASNHFSVAGVESIKNMFFYSSKYEGGMVCGPPPHVVCFANCEPDYSLMSRDRWQVMNLAHDNTFHRI